MLGRRVSLRLEAACFDDLRPTLSVSTYDSGMLRLLTTPNDFWLTASIDCSIIFVKHFAVGP